MKKLNITALLTILILFISCGDSIGKQDANAKGFENIENELKNKFGKDAYYTDLSITYDKSIGNMIGTTVTKDPESLKMGGWSYGNNTWIENSEIVLELPEGTEAKDFMFQLNDEINLSKLGELVEKSIKQLKIDKKIENPVLSTAFVKFPKNGDISNTEYSITLKPENGGTSFRYYYKLNGELIKMDY